MSHQLTLTSLVEVPNVLFVYSQAFNQFSFFIKFFTASPALVLNRIQRVSVSAVNKLDQLVTTPFNSHFVICDLFEGN